ncbi:Uncharacterized protein dnm_037290 [Desulfonema magnum]|uniref:Uncharacterized protein n=1 Tax=Desulfonema magnum TaxID=45655 RepID=A0A975BLN2_9BACT|nr:Uncharacterized protein dnm_037290 [Desulfonema magnum]
MWGFTISLFPYTLSHFLWHLLFHLRDKYPVKNFLYISAPDFF